MLPFFLFQYYVSHICNTLFHVHCGILNSIKAKFGFAFSRLALIQFQAGTFLKTGSVPAEWFIVGRSIHVTSVKMASIVTHHSPQLRSRAQSSSRPLELADDSLEPSSLSTAPRQTMFVALCVLLVLLMTINAILSVWLHIVISSALVRPLTLFRQIHFKFELIDLQFICRFKYRFIIIFIFISTRRSPMKSWMVLAPNPISIERFLVNPFAQICPTCLSKRPIR